MRGCATGVNAWAVPLISSTASFLFAFMCKPVSHWTVRFYCDSLVQVWNAQSREAFKVWNRIPPDTGSRAQAGKRVLKFASESFWRQHILFSMYVIIVLVGNCLETLRQHLGGINLVDRVMDGLLQYGGGTFEGSVALVDLLGYDAWPASYALIQTAAGKVWSKHVKTIQKHFFLLYNSCFFLFYIKRILICFM